MQRIKGWTEEWEKERHKIMMLSLRQCLSISIKTLCLTYLMLITILFTLAKMK